MFMKIYFNGIAKAMDGHNIVKISKKVIPATISLAWKGVGDEITSSMTAHNHILSSESNKLKSTKVNTIDFIDSQKNEKLHANNISLDKYKLPIKEIKELQKKYKNIDSLDKESMLKKSELLSKRIIGLKMSSDKNISSLDKESMLKKSELLSKRINNIGNRV